MRILVTGANGFIGSHLKARLERDGHVVFPYVRGGALLPHLFSFDPEMVVNCVAELDDPRFMFTSNVTTVQVLLDLVRETPSCRRMIQIGSSSELGPVEGARVDTDPCFPSNLYEATKLAATNLCIGNADEYGLDICVARPFTIYGSNDKPRKMLPTLWRAYTEGKPFTCHPGGHDWTHVDDFVEGICRLLAADESVTKGEIYHFGTGISTPNEEIVRLFERTAGALPKVEYRKDKLRPFDVMDWRAEWLKANTLLDWSPKIGIAEGIHRFVMDEYFKTERAPGL